MTIFAAFAAISLAGALNAATPVILISIDTLRADHAHTPAIAALARDGTTYSQIDAQVPMTLPSHLSLLTSTYPFANGIEENGQQIGAGAQTLAVVLKARGYRTAAFIGGYFLARQFGLDQGFDIYDSPFPKRALALKGAASLKRPAVDVIRSAEQWIKGNSSQPFFVLIHLFDLHQPYNEPARFRALFPGSEYDAELAYADSALAGFWAFLKRERLYSNSLIVLTSDHGESLGDHGESTHGYFIYESTLHVPLMFHWPGMSTKPPARVDAPGGLIDVAPTILESLGIPRPASFRGHSLLDGAAREVSSETFYAHDKFGWSPLRSLRMDNEKYIDAPHPELYDLASDPQERRNLASSDPARVRTLHQAMAALEAQDAGKHVSRAPVSPEVLANLRSLGYLGGSASHGHSGVAGADPKDKLSEYRAYLRARDLTDQGRRLDAIPVYKEILNDDPENVPAHDDLAQCYFSLRRLYEAERELKASLALDALDIPAEEMLATSYFESGDDGRARAEFEHLLSIAPEDYTAHYGLGLLDLEAAKLAEAVAHLKAATRARPNSAEARTRLEEALRRLRSSEKR